MLMAPRTIASQIYPHLPSVDAASPQRQQPRLADALYPNLAPPKLKSADQAWADAWNKRSKENLLKHLREANANLRAERKR
jgi:hypothetical protein